jgi:NAD(P)H-flavin reductase
MKYRNLITVTIALEHPLTLKAGQYVTISIPYVNIYPHPFVVTSWSEGPQTSLDLIIESRKGFTRTLKVHSKEMQLPNRGEVRGRDKERARRPTETYLVLLSGPHGRSVPAGNYEVVLMIASGFGIVALLPYMKQLIHQYNTRKIRTRRIRLVWQLTDDSCKCYESSVYRSLTLSRSCFIPQEPAKCDFGTGRVR